MSYAERRKFVIELIQLRISRGQSNINAIRRGINEVYPIEYLNIFKANELQQMLCGTVGAINMVEFSENVVVQHGVSAQTEGFFWTWFAQANDTDRRHVSIQDTQNLLVYSQFTNYTMY